MKKRFRPYGQLIVNVDWHTKLLIALKSAEEGTELPQVRTAILRLRDVLVEHDECIHTVTVTKPLPEIIDPAYVLSCVEDPDAGDVVRVALVEPRSIALTLTGRGSRTIVEFRAQHLLESVISQAKSSLYFAHELERGLP